MGNESLKNQAMSIDDQFAAISEKFGLPKNPVRTESIVSNSTNASAGPRKQKSVISKAADRLSKPKGGKNVKPIKKGNKGSLIALYINELSSLKSNFSLNIGADLLMDMFGPEESGYGSQSNTSTANSDPLASLDPLDRLGFEETFFKEKKEQELMDAAMAGQNLLGMVDEGPSRGYEEEKMRATGMQHQGSALMDFFVDPTQLFASERHPALQEVLKVLSRSKMHRGIFQKIPFVMSMMMLFGHFYSLRARLHHHQRCNQFQSVLKNGVFSFVRRFETFRKAQKIPFSFHNGCECESALFLTSSIY